MDENIKCPICHEKHSILNEEGEIKEYIECNCGSLIEWVSGAGYYAITDDLKMIPC